ncbi:MAG: tetratricopeptide repeat protein [Terriglobales bacterium]
MILPLALALATALPAPVAQCQQLRRHGAAASAQACFERLAASPDHYLAAEGDWGLEQYDAANGQFRLAAAADDHNATVRVRWGRLLLARFNDADAEALFQEALQRDPNEAEAYLGEALVSADGFDGKALASAHKAVALDPKLAEAHVLLATLALEDSDPATAGAEAALALTAQADDLDAMAIQAAIAVLAAPPNQAAAGAGQLAKIAAINPHYGAADAAIAEQLVLNRRYDEAVAWYRKAVALDPELWSAHSALGITLMRLGQAAAPETELQLAYDHGWRDAATVNSLRLLDSYKNFDLINDGAFVLKLDKKESALLRPYFEQVVRQALSDYSAKYGMTLPGPVQVEAYPNHEDFAVRSIGLPGLGALGVTFGEVVAMDSPSGRPPGDFNWASTLRHELDHVFVLTATHHLVPRWFAEGLAVHEETQANPEWGDRITPDILVAIHAGKLLPVAQLDRGFMHPDYAGQVAVSYYQAGRICDFIQAQWGAPKLVEMVRDFAVPTTTPAVLQAALGLAPAAFDAQFSAWLARDLGAVPGNFDVWRNQLKALVGMASGPAPRWDEVIALAQKVRDLYPDYIYDATPYGYLADAYQAQSDRAAAAQALTDYEHRGGHDPARLKQLATLESELGQPQLAAATLDRINDIYPSDADLHARLGSLWLGQKNFAGAIREFAAAVALHPLDQAGAQYHLAEAYFAAGQLDSAQDHVIAALVAAHDYRPAQDLLVKIMDAKKPR